MYDYLTREDNPFPPAAEHSAPKVLCRYSYQGACYADIGDWRVDMINNNGITAVVCRNQRNLVNNHTIYYDDGTVKVE